MSFKIKKKLISIQDSYFVEEEHVHEGRSYGGKFKIITQRKGEIHMDLTIIFIFFLI